MMRNALALLLEHFVPPAFQLRGDRFDARDLFNRSDFMAASLPVVKL
jgi:hypothetical protein